MSQMRVFVSHSSQDKAFADALVRELRAAGADVWYDQHNLGAGVLRREIMRELSGRPVFVVVLSKAALGSDWVQDECEWAYNLSKREPQRIMLPVVAARYDASDFNALLYLESLKRVEGLGHQPFPEAEAIEGVLRELALTPAGKASAAAAPQPGTDVESLVAHGKALMAQQQYEQAIHFFQVATVLAPDNFDAWYNLNWAHNELGHWLEALTAVEWALTIRPNSTAAWNNKGTALKDLNRSAEALVAFDRALALDPSYAIAWTNKGVALRNLQRYEEALDAYNQALALDSDVAMAWYNKGVTLGSLNRSAEALVAFDRALALDPSYANAWNNRGVALIGLHCYDEALTALERALALEQTATRWANTAIALRALGRYAEAREAERRAKELGG